MRSRDAGYATIFMIMSEKCCNNNNSNNNNIIIIKDSKHKNNSDYTLTSHRTDVGKNGGGCIEERDKKYEFELPLCL